MKLGIYKVVEKATMPTRATDESSCYDISACLHGDINVYLKGGKAIKSIQHNDDKDVDSIVIRPRERVAVPTGIILDIPTGYEVKLYARSGLSLKMGISLSNSVGVIDCDYKDELYVTVINNSDDVFILEDGMRIAQFDMTKKSPFDIEEVSDKPVETTNRKGGLGSTGTKSKSSDTDSEKATPRRTTKSIGTPTKSSDEEK